MSKPLITTEELEELCTTLSTHSFDGSAKVQNALRRKKRRAIMRLYWRINGRLFDRGPKLSVREAVRRMASQ